MQVSGARSDLLKAKCENVLICCHEMHVSYACHHGDLVSPSLCGKGSMSALRRGMLNTKACAIRLINVSMSGPGDVIVNVHVSTVVRCM